MKLPLYDLSLHFWKFRFRFPKYADDNTPNTYTHKAVTTSTSSNSERWKYNFNDLHPAAFYRLSSNRDVSHSSAEKCRSLPSLDQSASYHMTDYLFRLWKITQMSKILLVGGSFVPSTLLKPCWLRNFVEETLLHQRQKDKRLLLTSSAAIFLNILCSKTFFSNEKIGKCSWKIQLTQRLTQLCFSCESTNTRRHQKMLYTCLSH